MGERLVDLAADQHPTERHVPGVHPFREDQQVRGDPVVVDGEPCSGAAEPDQHLVGDQDDAMTSAQLPDAPQIASRRHDDPGAAGHGFQDQCRDGRRTFQQHHLLEMRERPLALFLGCARPERRAVQEGAEEVDGARGAGVRGPPAWVTRQVDRGRRRAVVRAVRSQHLGTPGVQASHPHRMLDRLRTAGGEEHVPEALRCDLDDHARRLAAHVRCMTGARVHSRSAWSFTAETMRGCW